MNALSLLEYIALRNKIFSFHHYFSFLEDSGFRGPKNALRSLLDLGHGPKVFQSLRRPTVKSLECLTANWGDSCWLTPPSFSPILRPISSVIDENPPTARHKGVGLRSCDPPKAPKPSHLRSIYAEGTVFTEKDFEQIRKRGMNDDMVLSQMDAFKQGFPFARLERPCTLGDGIVSLKNADHEKLIDRYSRAANRGRFMKFVPASGAASRMFKSLLSVLGRMNHAQGPLREKPNESDPDWEAFSLFMENIHRFPFFHNMQYCLKKDNLDVETLLERGHYHKILLYLLTSKGLNLASRPKGLIPFHRYPGHVRTPFEEHLLEGASYVKDRYGTVPIHFTVSPEHDRLFRDHLDAVIPRYESSDLIYNVSFSYQAPSTDTIAVDMENRPLRDEAGKLIFRPGGHGALLANLHQLNGDIIFIKNIDNVVVDRLKDTTYHYKMVLGGYLVDLQEALFQQLMRLSEMNPNTAHLEEAFVFARDRLSLVPPDGILKKARKDIRRFLINSLNRPLRVCGMVKNVKEPGGGPFWVRDRGGRLSIQIIESSQVNHASKEQRQRWGSSTHFNPVDLVCAVRDFKGNPFDLPSFADPETGFIAEKSKDGKTLKALELPGLWNGAMAHWNTVFIEVPLATFNPVKTVSDLLREEHQGEE